MKTLIDLLIVFGIVVLFIVCYIPMAWLTMDDERKKILGGDMIGAAKKVAKWGLFKKL